MTTSDRARSGALAALVILILAAACADPTTAIVVSFSTDMHVPDELDELVITIAHQGTVHSTLTYDLDPSKPGAVLLPATLTLLAGKDPASPVRITAAGHLDRKPVVERVAQLPFIKDKELLLRMVLLRRCVDRDCPEGTSCTERGCIAIEVDPEELPVFDDEQPLGLPDAALDAAPDPDGGDGGDAAADGPALSPDAGCAGCSGANGCEPGNTAEACGLGGSDCQRCVDDDPCTEDLCSPTGDCSNPTLDDGTSCPDGACCAGVCCAGCCDGGSCAPGSASGACGSGGAACKSCVDPDPCTSDVCNADGSCSNPTAQNGTACPTGQCCGGTCCAGCCQGSTCVAGDAVSACGKGGNSCKSCVDSNPCTSDSCSAAGSCSNSTVGDGTGCSGGLCCGGSCRAGAQCCDSADCNGCLGTADACSTANCATQQGCSSSSSCKGSVNCGAYDSSPSQCMMCGCSSSVTCDGSPSCSGKSSIDCGNCSGCYWGTSCVGTATLCASLTGTACSAQLGCHVPICTPTFQCE